MTPADIDRVFGRGRLRMVTGDHVEVFREQSQPGERRRYTKRFLATAAGDFSEWTEREWRILARLVGHGIKPVPDVVRFDRGASDRAALVQTYDAGITVDHWATLLPLERDGTTLRNVFEDCAHWWALARSSLVALDAIHELRLVHLDLKADNVCIPAGPADFDPHIRGQRLQPRFDDIALIDFAFSLVSGERLESALPIAQQADYEYQSPRLLHALEAGRHGDLAPTRQLDWRCDLFSLAAMLWRYLPEPEDTTTGDWTRPRHARARALVRRLIEAHDAELPATRPHAELIALATEPLSLPALGESLQRGWTLAFDSRAAAPASTTPVTRIALPVVAPAASAAQAAMVAPAGAAAAVAAPAGAATAAPVLSAAAMPAFSTAAAPVPGSAVEDEPPIAPGFDRQDSRESLAVDPTDVALRLRAHRRDREQRQRRLVRAASVAGAGLAAMAALAWLEPSWRALADPRDRDVAIAPTVAPTRAPLPAPVAPVTAGEAPPSATPKPAPEVPVSTIAAVPIDASAPAVTPAANPPSPAEDAGTPTAVETSGPSAAGTLAAGPAPKAAPATVPPHPRNPEPHVRPSALARAAEPTSARSLPARSARAAPTPFPAPSRVARANAAKNAATKPLASPAGTASLASSRRAARAGAFAGHGAPMPWAVAGRAAPRVMLARAAGSGESGALLPLSTSSPAPAAATPSRTETGSSMPVGVNPRASPAPSPPATPLSTAALAVVARPALSTDTAAATSAPTVAVPPLAATDSAAIDYAARASELMAHQVPRLAQRAERTVARVLFVAGRSERVSGDEEIRAAASAVGRDAGDALAGLSISVREAQRLGEAARAEYARRGGTAESLALQARAFGANPLDVEAAGNLAFL
ncbi:MAG: hypothetical protein ABIQ33_08180, partial [Caldimonas sp.]